MISVLAVVLLQLMWEELILEKIDDSGAGRMCTRKSKQAKRLEESLVIVSPRKNEVALIGICAIQSITVARAT